MHSVFGENARVLQILVVLEKVVSPHHPKQQEGQLSPRDPNDTHYRLKYCRTVVRIKTDHISALGALSATATLYSATCTVLYTHRCTRHNYCTASMQCCVHHQQTFVQPILLMSTGLYLWSTNVDYHQSFDDNTYYSASAPSWMRTTVADGHKFSAVRYLSFKQQKWPWRSFLRSPIMVCHLIGHIHSY